MADGIKNSTNPIIEEIEMADLSKLKEDTQQEIDELARLKRVFPKFCVNRF